MKKSVLKQYLDQIIIKQCGLEKTYFSSKSNNGENLIIQKELLQDPLDLYEVLSSIEHKYNVLINDELLFRNGITYGEFIDICYNEINKLKK